LSPDPPHAAQHRYRVTADEPSPSLHLRRDAVRDGWSDDELGRLVRSGELSRLRRGAYVNGTLPSDAAANHALLVRATLAGLRRPAVVSHQSAAVLLGLPLWDVPLDRVHVTRRPGAWNDSGRLLCCHVARLGDDEVVEVDGGSGDQSGPHRAGPCPLPAARGGHAGTRNAARAVPAADGRSGSVGEAGSRVLLNRWKLPPSALQFEVRSGDGRLIGRTDFAWEEHRLVGEFDGRVTYGRLLRPGEDPGDAVAREKGREDAIRDEGWGVVRWTWSDLGQPHRVAARVRRRMR
jgi:hypothetical protein